ncbi:MAG: hypothetical protein CMP43_00945 [Rickettsiales bacterium]|nr:hypothetical protein [Rickettsiales bacterium]|tara:strand:- start:1895 stop:2770 length:876 start_codon:yes stop_codon:yes gene_type:complete
MYKIGIISDVHDWHTDQIESSLKKRKCKITRIFFEDLIFSFKKNKINFFNNKNLSKFDGIWVRFINSGSIEEITTKLTILHLFKECKIYVHNSADVIEKTVDKVRSTGLLRINGFLTPDTYVWFEKKKTFFPKGVKKILVKPIFGSQGKNIFMINKPEDVKGTEIIGGVFYVQEFINSEKKNIYSDIRVLVSNHRIVSAMERESKNFITNVYQGAKCKKIVINQKLRRLASKVSRLFNLGYAGIDIKIDKDKFSVLEINSVPSWKALQKIEKINISEVLVNDFLKKVKCRK